LFFDICKPFFVADDSIYCLCKMVDEFWEVDHVDDLVLILSFESFNKSQKISR
jgi:hypothetical protein